jgi:hypothetical protein
VSFFPVSQPSFSSAGLKRRPSLLVFQHSRLQL